MKKCNKRILICIVGLLVAISLLTTSCGGDPMVGTWTCAWGSPDNDMTLNEDGTYVGWYGSENNSGNWERQEDYLVLDNGTLTVNYVITEYDDYITLSSDGEVEYSKEK